MRMIWSLATPCPLERRCSCTSRPPTTSSSAPTAPATSTSASFASRREAPIQPTLIEMCTGELLTQCFPLHVVRTPGTLPIRSFRLGTHSLSLDMKGAFNCQKLAQCTVMQVPCGYLRPVLPCKVPGEDRRGCSWSFNLVCASAPLPASPATAPSRGRRATWLVAECLVLEGLGGTGGHVSEVCLLGAVHHTRAVNAKTQRLMRRGRSFSAGGAP